MHMSFHDGTIVITDKKGRTMIEAPSSNLNVINYSKPEWAYDGSITFMRKDQKKIEFKFLHPQDNLLVAELFKGAVEIIN